MKKIVSVLICLVTLTLPAGCGVSGENTVNRILFDTAVTLSAGCDRAVLLEAIKLCEDYEALLSRTAEGSDVYRINHTDGFAEVDARTVEIIKTALEYCEKTNGRYDITITPVSELWDFKNRVIPGPAALEAAMRLVDYRKIEINGNCVNANGASIDLGSAAKGYIADRLRDFFVQRGISEAVINLGGNLYVLCTDYQTVGIRSPSDPDAVAASVRLRNKTAVTSGIYQRCFEADGVLYHHIIDPDTGRGVENDLAGVTILGESSLTADILSTACMLLGSEAALNLLSEAPGVEAVLILRDGSIKTTAGLTSKNGVWEIG